MGCLWSSWVAKCTSTINTTFTFNLFSSISIGSWLQVLHVRKLEVKTVKAFGSLRIELPLNCHWFSLSDQVHEARFFWSAPYAWRLGIRTEEAIKGRKKRDTWHIFIRVNIKICLIQLGSCPTLVVVYTEDDLIYIRKNLTFLTSNYRLDINYRLCDSFWKYIYRSLKYVKWTRVIFIFLSIVLLLL